MHQKTRSRRLTQKALLLLLLTESDSLRLAEEESEFAARVGARGWDARGARP